MRNTFFLALILAFSFSFSVAAFAKDKDEGSFDLSQPARIGSVQLQPGHYKAEWTGTNGNVNVMIMQRGKTVASTTAQVKELATPASYSAVTLQTTPKDQARIAQIQFNNRRDELVLGASAS